MGDPARFSEVIHGLRPGDGEVGVEELDEVFLGGLFTFLFGGELGPDSRELAGVEPVAGAFGHSSTRVPRFTLWKCRIMISWTLGQRMRLLRSTLSVGSRSTSRNFSPGDSCASSTRASSNQSNHIPPHPPAHTSTETPSASILVMTFEHSGHSITRSSPPPGSRALSISRHLGPFSVLPRFLTMDSSSKSHLTQAASPKGESS